MHTADRVINLRLSQWDGYKHEQTSSDPSISTEKPLENQPLKTEKETEFC
jgi:hypothetical protein